MKNFGCTLRLVLGTASAIVGLATSVNASEEFEDALANQSIGRMADPLTSEPMAKLNRVADLTEVQSSDQKRLPPELTNELNLVQQRVENLQPLPQPFSTTTKLNGEVVLALVGLDADRSSDDSNLILGSRVRLNFDTSFTGDPRLRTRLQASNIARIDRAAGTDMARLAFQGSSENQFQISRLEYTFPLNEQVDVYLEAVGGSLNDFTNTLNPFLSGSSVSSISRFGQRNPIYRQGGGSGLGIKYEFNDAVSLTLGYLADDVNDPEVGFNAAYGAIAQLTVEFGDSGLGLTYVRSYNSLQQFLIEQGTVKKKI